MMKRKRSRRREARKDFSIMKAVGEYQL